MNFFKLTFLLTIVSHMALGNGQSFIGAKSNLCVNAMNYFSQQPNTSPIVVKSIGSSVQFYVFTDIKGEQGVMTIRTDAGKNIISEEVELVRGSCFKTIKQGELPKGNYVLLINTEKEEFLVNFKL